MTASSQSTTSACANQTTTTSTQTSRETFVRRATWMALVLIVLAAAVAAVDLPASQFAARKAAVRNHPIVGRLAKIVDLCEFFGYGGTVLLVILLAGSLDPAGLRAMPRLLAGAFGGGLAADAVKMLVSRIRPKAADLNGSVLATFQGWLPILHESSRQHQFQSFPSAHTATAFGLATVLAWRHPRGALIFFLLAALAGLQRVQARDHFVSDVFVGAAIGILCGAACVGPYLPGRWFNRLESVASTLRDRVD
jgi:membrane-associated phospholipid phosphatase